MHQCQNEVLEDTERVERAAEAHRLTPGPIQSVQVVINPAAGRPEPALARIAAAWQDTGLAWEISVTHGPGDAESIARRAVEAGFDAVAAYGGDGTVMEAAVGLLGSTVPLLVLPGGTANAFADALRMPGDLTAACRLLVSVAPAARQVDVGRVGDAHFLLQLGIGLEAQVTLVTTPDLKERFGVAAYSLAGAPLLLKPPHASYRLRLDGKWAECEGLNCMVANSGHLGFAGLTVTPDGKLDDGLLEVVILRDTSPFTLVGAAAKLLRRAEHPALACWQVREVMVEADPPLEVVRDGEAFGRTPLTAQVLPRALTVVVPEAS